jgi:hypothetical protein
MKETENLLVAVSSGSTSSFRFLRRYALSAPRPSRTMSLTPSPPTLNLPPGSILVEDVDEEVRPSHLSRFSRSLTPPCEQIFLLYTRKQELSSTSPTSGDAQAATATGLGAMDREGVLNLSLTVPNPWVTMGNGGKKVGKGGRSKGKQKEEVVVEVELHQSLDALRNRKGDTGAFLLSSPCIQAKRY